MEEEVVAQRVFTISEVNALIPALSSLVGEQLLEQSEIEHGLAELEKIGVQAIVALGREGKNQGAIDAKRYPARARMAERLATPEGKAHYRRRKVIPEPVFGWIKHVMGFRQFSLRGLTKVAGEWSLVCLALNVRRMWALQT